MKINENKLSLRNPKKNKQSTLTGAMDSKHKRLFENSYKSSIDSSTQEYDNFVGKPIKKIKDAPEFMPKYKNSSPCQQRIRDFHINSTIDLDRIYVKKKPVKERIEYVPPKNARTISSIPNKISNIMEENLTARERRIKELNPTLNSIEIQRLASRSRSNLNSPVKEIVEKNIRNYPFLKKQRNLNSNIFSKEILNNTDIFSKTITTPTTTKLPSNYEWLYTNTEIIYNEKEKKNIKSEESFSNGKELNGLASSSKFNRKNINRSTDDETNMAHEELTKVLEEIYGENSSKLKKSLDNVSSLYTNDFYSTFKIKKGERDNDCYIIENTKSKNFDTMNINEIKSLFNKNGIHVFDFKEKGKFYQGNQTGLISFKIRKNNDIKEFDQRMNNILNNINSLGFNIKAEREVKPNIIHSKIALHCNNNFEKFQQKINHLKSSNKIQTNGKYKFNEKNQKKINGLIKNTDLTKK